jgi:hypothetical protein
MLRMRTQTLHFNGSQLAPRAWRKIAEGERALADADQA